MKKLILSLLLASMLLPSFAQSKIDFFDFVRDFDWNMSESDFRTKYKDRIVVLPDSLLRFGLIELSDIYLEKYKTITCIRYDEQTQKPIITLRLDSFGALDYLEIEKFIDEKLGNPDYATHEEVYSYSSEDTPIYSKVWLKGTYAFTLALYEDSTGYVFFIAIQEKNQELPKAGKDREPDFRQGYWGDSMEEIKKKEGKPNGSDIQGIYSFLTYVNGMECIATYRFTNNMLTLGKYIFTTINTDNCVRNYQQLSDLLTTKYGNPISKEKKSIAEDYEQEVLSEGQLISMGKLRLETIWDTPTTFLGILLYGEEYQPILIIEYYSKLHQEELEKDILKDL